jgi:hypothetical protein
MDEPDLAAGHSMTAVQDNHRIHESEGCLLIGGVYGTVEGRQVGAF